MKVPLFLPFSRETCFLVAYYTKDMPPDQRVSVIAAPGLIYQVHLFNYARMLHLGDKFLAAILPIRRLSAQNTPLG
jgi:hypothetical protein